MDSRNKDKLLVVNLKKGNVRAFDKLFEKYSRKLYYFAIGYLKSEEDAEEIVQDIFVKIWENRNELNELLSFNSYLFTIAKNTMLNRIRKKVNEQNYKEYLKNCSTIEHNSTMNEVIFADLERFTDKAIEKLPPRRRQIYVLSRKEGLTYKEIAAQMEISKKTVEIQMSKAIAYMNNFLSKEIKIMLFAFIFLPLV